MKQTHKRIIAAIIFVLILILILIIINNFYIHFAFERNTSYIKHEQYQIYLKNESNTTPDFAFFGDSIVMGGINSEFINGSYNFGNGAETYFETYHKLKNIISNKDIQIKNIFVQFDFHSFKVTNIDQRRFIRDTYIYSKYIPLNMMSLMSGYSEPTVYIKSIFPVIGRGEEFLSFLILTPDFKIGDHGFLWNNLTSTSQERIQQSKKVINSLNNSNAIDPHLLYYFLKVINLAKENNITVVLITYPASKELQGVIDKNNDMFSRSNLREYEISKAENISSEIIILNYYDYFTNNSEYFADLHHLNRLGADELSKKIYEDLTLMRLTESST